MAIPLFAAWAAAAIAYKRAIDVELQHRGRGIARPPHICRNDFEAQFTQPKAIYKYIDDPCRVILINEVIEAVW
jgi:hypothetical protein